MALCYNQNEQKLGTNSLMLVPTVKKVSKGAFTQAMKKMPL
jgi:hypothetical protein